MVRTKIIIIHKYFKIIYGQNISTANYIFLLLQFLINLLFVILHAVEAGVITGFSIVFCAETISGINIIKNAKKMFFMLNIKFVFIN